MSERDVGSRSQGQRARSGLGQAAAWLGHGVGLRAGELARARGMQARARTCGRHLGDDGRALCLCGDDAFQHVAC